ncbi:diaminohydroxyphosphoribosylaminopyrimidine deaminase [Moraxella ovis]|uniref:Bcr/CflA family efflux transporter n=1 Tax=Moraxella ovis TaxID=29433 RepID=A0A378PHI3_9GAMM|nr:multidrug effflux MFS transporter [Moraxella ovis]ANB90809.1 diaminohydroxyphosphoribosylaminopyrimidine deaminase [Moraxella ovis]STY86235.1 Sulfonamide resistance protein [Moraxella ovis]
MNQNQSAHEKPFPTVWILILGMMIAIGPLAIDMYLPALPSMADEFGVSTTNVARSVPAYFVGLVFGQLFYGPFSDRVGRVKPMYIGMTIFVIASIICATTNHEYVLFAARTLQALGACVTAVVTRAAIRDTLNPVQSARAFSLMVLVMGVAPILAPTLGAAILQVANWHMLFWFLAGYGVLNIILTKLFLKETLAPENRNTRPMSETFLGYVDLMKDKTFTVPAVAAGLLQGSFFIYLSISSVLFMENYGLSEKQFAIAFGANAFGFIALTQANQFLTKRFRLVRLLRFGALMQVISALCLLVLGVVFGGEAYFAAVFLAIFCCIVGLGFTQPNATAIALAFQKKRAGMAAAMQGALQFSVGIFGGLLLSLFDVSPVLKLGIAMSVLTAIGTYLVYRLNPRLDLSKMD